MKILVFGILFFTLVITCANVESDANTPKRYPKSKSGIIKYEISGATIMGTEVVYYDDWGRREAKYTNTTMDLGGVTVNRNTLTLLEDNGRWISNVDLNGRTGIKMENPRYKEYVGKSKIQLEKIAKKNLIDAGARRTEIERVAGKPCVVWGEQYTGIETYTWNGIILKKISGPGFSRTITEATEIIELVPIPEGKFTIPPDIQMKTVKMSTFRGN